MLFHSLGGPQAGQLFLPMHLGVLMSGLLLGPLSGAVVGTISPLLGFLILGMPVAAKLPLMMIELCCYGLIAGLLFKTNLPIIFKLLITQCIGRGIYGLLLAVVSVVFQLDIEPWKAVAAAFITGLPGIAIQLILIPLLIMVLQRSGLFAQQTDKS